eukprot:11863612-Heterocapsa_arctica.AAC.1
MEVVEEASGHVVQGPFLINGSPGHADVSEAMGRVVRELGQGQLCSTHIIVLHIEGPMLPSVDLVDMPGLVAVPDTMREAESPLA